jgi:hypothetical protein
MAFYTPKENIEAANSDLADNSELPYVLLIGDSISQGYTPIVRENLKTFANVLRPKTNCGDTLNGIKNISEWLGDRDWDVIHFNWGLHDLCYRNPESKVYGFRDKEKGKISVPIDQYEENLEILVEKMLPHGKRLVWCNTSFIPEGEAGRFTGDDIKYNDVAKQVMMNHDIKVNDIHSLTSSFDEDFFIAPGDVHFTPTANNLLAKQVSDMILHQINHL